MGISQNLVIFKYPKYVLSPLTLLCDTLYQKMVLSDFNFRLIYIPFMKRSFTNCYKYVLWIMNECIFMPDFFFAHCKLLQKATDKNFLISTVKTCTCTCIAFGNRKLPLELQAKKWFTENPCNYCGRKICSVVPVWYTLYMTFYGDTHRVT